MCPEQTVTHVSGMHRLPTGPLEGIRTPDPRFRRPMLYPLSYERVPKRESLP